MQHGLLTEATDLSSADWVAARLTTFAENVASIIPSGFEAYARIFHPAYRRDGDEYTPVLRADVAASTGRKAHHQMQWEGVSGQPLYGVSPTSELWTESPDTGRLPRQCMESLLLILRHATTTPEQAWFLTWHRYGDHRVDPRPGAYGYLKRRRFGLPSRPPKPVKPRRNPLPPLVLLPAREYYLLGGPVEGALETMAASGVEGWEPRWQSANLWWPEDRAWFVSTEIDFACTYVGGTRDIIEAILASPEFEARPASLDDAVASNSDRVNPISDPPDPL